MQKLHLSYLLLCAYFVYYVLYPACIFGQKWCVLRCVPVPEELPCFFYFWTDLMAAWWWSIIQPLLRHRTSSSCPMLWPLMTPKDFRSPELLSLLSSFAHFALVRYFTKNIRPHGHIFPPEGNPLDTLEELAPPASKDRLEQLRSMGGNEAKLASQIEKEWMYRYVPLSSVVIRCHAATAWSVAPRSCKQWKPYRGDVLRCQWIHFWDALRPKPRKSWCWLDKGVSTPYDFKNRG